MKIFVFDVESVGLHGEAYAVGGGLYGPNGEQGHEFLFSVNPDLCKGYMDDRNWIEENIPKFKYTHHVPGDLRDAFWQEWKTARSQTAMMAADCCWPVEANFLSACIQDDVKGRKWEGPYPLMDISTMIYASRKNPLDKYGRIRGEEPEHNPLADARQSARLLFEAMIALDLI